MDEKEPGQAYCEWEANEWAAVEAAIRADERAKVIEECAKVAETFGEPNRFTVPDEWRQDLKPSDVYEVAAVDVSLWIESAIRAISANGDK